MKVSYEKLQQDTETLIEKIKANINGRQIYDNVYAVPRGGIYAGALIAHALELDQVDTEDEVGPFTLIVDDLIDSGTTRRKYWEQDFAVIYTKGKSDIVPTYFVEEIDDWIEFPWEQTEQDINDHVTRLLEFFQHDVTPKNIEKVRTFLSYGEL